MTTTTTPGKRVIPFCVLKLSLHARSAQTNVKVNDNQSLEEKKNVPCFKKKKDWVTICAQQRKEERKEEEEEAANEFRSPECWQEMESRYKKRERGRGRKWDISLKAGELDTGIAQNQNPQEQRATENIQTADFRETPTSGTCAVFCFINWYLIWSFHGRQKKRKKKLSWQQKGTLCWIWQASRPTGAAAAAAVRDSERSERLS